MNLGLQLILSGMIRRAIGPAPEPTLVENFRLARNAVANVLAVPKFTLNVRASKTIGPNPLIVKFDLLSDSVFPGISRPEHELSFWTDFDDPDSVFENIPAGSLFGNSANVIPGVDPAHAWLEVGSKLPKFYVYDHRTGDFGYQEMEITIQDADTVFAGRTVVCSTSSDFTGSPAGATQTTSFAAAKAALASLGNSAPSRCLFRCGDTFTVGDELYPRTNSHTGSFGTGAKPKFVSVPGGLTGGNKSMIYSSVAVGSGSTIYGLDLQGDYDPVTGTGDNWTDRGILVQYNSKVSIYQCDIKGFGLPIYVSESGDTFASEVTILDNNVTDWQDLGVYPSGDGMSIIGNRIAQNVNAVSGPGEKGSYQNDFIGDGVTTNFVLSNVKIFGDVSNLAVFLRDNSTLVLTELILDTDFTFTIGGNDSGAGNSTHEIDLLIAAPSSSFTIEAFTRRWADHGPIRVPFGKWSCVRNVLESYNGWASEGSSIQSCVRDNSSGRLGARSFIAENYCIGGEQVIVVQPQKKDDDQRVSSAVINSNYLQGDESTTGFIQLRAGNVTIKNNIGFLPDVAAVANPLNGCVLLENSGDLFDSYALPVRIINNTWAVLRSTANGANDTETIYDTFGDRFTDVAEANTLFYYPDRPTPLPDYTPLSEDGLYRPLEGSAALGAGTANDLVWDDFAGNLTGEVSSLGAYNTAGAAAGEEYFFDFSTGTIDTQPAGSTLKRNAVAGDYLIKDDGGVNVLRFQSTGAENARGLAFIQLTEVPSELEIYAPIRDANTTPASARIVAFASDAPDSELGAYINKALNQRLAYRRVSGSFTSLVTQSVTISDVLYYHTLTKIIPGSPNQIKFKMWTGDSVIDEPLTWDIETTDATLDISAGGWVGFVGFDSAAPVYYKNLGIGVDIPAPRSPL